MCLNPFTMRKYRTPRDWVEMYKVVKRRGKGRYYSCLATQRWEFAKAVKARRPKLKRLTKGRVEFGGRTTRHYDSGIHGYRLLSTAMRGVLDSSLFQTLPTTKSPFAFTKRIIKVLAFGVTHYDNEAFRADWAVPIEMMDGLGRRIPWEDESRKI